MIQDGLKRKDKDLAKMKKHIIELLDQAWIKGYIAGFDDGYRNGRNAGAYIKDADPEKPRTCPNCGSEMHMHCEICDYEEREDP